MKDYEYRQRVSLPLSAKIHLSIMRIRQAYSFSNGNMYVSFSGGKDSTVLLHLVRSVYPDTPAVFVDTGLEYPEIKDFAMGTDNVVTIRPEKTFKDVINQYGYPVISKEVSRKIRDLRNPNISEKYRDRLNNGCEKGNATKLPTKWRFLLDAPFKISDQCCDHLKKKPIKKYEKETGRLALIGSMASESRLRLRNYLKNGCNSFNSIRPVSNPLSVWTDQDVWNYIKINNIPYSKIYDTGVNRTGCMFCMFGCHAKKDSRFDLMRESHPNLYHYCMNNLNLSVVLKYIKDGISK